MLTRMSLCDYFYLGSILRWKFSNEMKRIYQSLKSKSDGNGMAPLIDSVPF